MESIENVLRFIGSYPTWAKALAMGGIIVTAATLVFAPRLTSDPDTKPLQSSGNAVLRMLGVTLFPSNPGVAIQVTAFVNGSAFEYPSLADVEWLEVGPAMSKQNFPLPKAEMYEIRFEMRMNDFSGGPIGEFVSQDIQTIRILPYVGEYNVHKKLGALRSAAVSASIRFAVEVQ